MTKSFVTEEVHVWVTLHYVGIVTSGLVEKMPEKYSSIFVITVKENIEKNVKLKSRVGIFFRQHSIRQVQINIEYNLYKSPL